VSVNKAMGPDMCLRLMTETTTPPMVGFPARVITEMATVEAVEEALNEAVE